MTRHKFGTLACLSALALVAVGCGSDGGSSDNTAADTTPAATEVPTTTVAGTEAPTTEGATGEETRGVTDTEIKVGGIVPKIQGFNYEDMCTGSQVLFDKVNEAGGVHGRQITMADCRDDQATPDVSIQEATRLIEQDGVFAIVPAGPQFAGSSIAIDTNTPFFGWGINPFFCDNEQGFGFNGCTGPNDPNWENPTWASLLLKAKPDVKTVAMLGHDIPAGKVNMDAISRGAEMEGLEIVYSDTSVPITGVTDWTPYVQSIIQSGADAVMVQLQQAIPFIAALKAAGYDGVTQNAVAYDPRTLQDPAGAEVLEGQYMNVQFVPYESSDPAIQTLKDDVAKYAGADQLLTVALGQGYLSAQMFVDLLEAAGPDLTTESFFAAADGFSFDGDGTVGSITFPEAHASNSGCEALVQAVAGKFVEVVPLTCAPGVGQIGTLPG